MTTLAIFPADEGGCGHYRLIWPAEAMQRAGYQIVNKGVNAGIPSVSVTTDKGYTVPISLTEEPDFDIAVIQRPSHPAMQALIQLWKKRGVEVVIDLDDNFMRVDPRNVVWKRYQAENKNFDGIKHSLALADRVVFSTGHLAAAYRRYVKGRVYIRKNCLPPHAYASRARRDEPRNFGWAGFVGTHPTDLQVMGGAVRSVLKMNVYDEFVHVGNPHKVDEILGVKARHVGGVSLQDYHASLDEIDVGLVPLADNDFNRSKSYLKGLEYMGRGIPALATALPEYELLEGCELVERPKDWKRAILGMVNRYRERSERSLALALHHHIDLWALDWAEAWTGEAKDDL